jgi:protein SCO1/2
MERKVLWAGMLVLAGLLGAAALMTYFKQREFHGVVISPAPAAPDLTSLSDQNGKMFSLADHRGKVVLLFFGYTSCPDICPATMGRLKQVASDLGGYGDDLDVVFITTDPARDTREKLGNYLANFNPEFLGLTGSVSDLENAWKNYGVTVLDEGASHSTRIYAIDKAGELRLTFPNEMSVNEMVADLIFLLSEQ